MRKIVFVLTILLLCGLTFLIAGHWGLTESSLAFGLIYAIVYLFYRKKTFKWKWFLLSFGSSSLIVYALLVFGGMSKAEDEVTLKLSLLKSELEKEGHQPKWFIISQRRNPVFNAMLANSVDGSEHLKGKAIDIFVLDINGDGTFDLSDIELMEKANKQVERNHPNLKGAFGDYFLSKNSALTQHMIHIDTRGYRHRYPRIHKRS
jgi:energy-coupling factor transporter transmembrane protein EcfT